MSIATTEPIAPPGAPAARPPRAWPAILTLLFLAPLTAEVLSGSTPVLAFTINPIVAFINLPFYGCGALLAREVARRRGLGWGGVLWLGAAYGIFEEGVVLNTWADPWASVVCTIVRGAPTGLCDYSRVGGINLLWALNLTIYHAVISITIPILLVSLLFPARDARPAWLGRKAIIACVASELIILVLGLILNFADFRQHGQPGPLPLPYLIELALMAGCVALALLLRARPTRPASAPYPARSTRPLPGLWRLRFFAFVAVALTILSPSVYQAAHAPYQLALAINATLLALAVWRVWAWSRRADWNAHHLLALASGALGFFIVFWAPLLEILGTAGGKPEHGTGVVALAYLLFLIALTRHTNRRLRRAEEAETPALA